MRPPHGGAQDQSRMIWERFSLLMRTSGLVAMQRAQTAAQKTQAPANDCAGVATYFPPRGRFGGPILRRVAHRNLALPEHDGAPRPWEARGTCF